MRHIKEKTANGNAWINMNVSGTYKNHLKADMTEKHIAGGKMKIKLDKGAYMPIRAHKTDAGLDLRTPQKVTVPAHGSVTIDTGVHIALPSGYYGKLESKSGLNVKHNVVSLGGTLDEPYRGSIVAKLYNLGDMDYTFEEGDKVVQMVIQPYIAPNLEEVDELDETDRGESGFGSSGR